MSTARKCKVCKKVYAHTKEDWMTEYNSLSFCSPHCEKEWRKNILKERKFK